MNDTKVSKKTLGEIAKNSKLNWKHILFVIWTTELKSRGVSYEEFIEKLKLKQINNRLIID